jgi:hypothetical protein
MPGLRNDPIHVIINRKVLGEQLREKLYGRPTKFQDRSNRVYWANIIGYWVRRQVLTYSDVREVGETLARRLAPDHPLGDGEYDEALDGKLRHCLTGALNAEAERVAGTRTADDQRELKAGVHRKRVYAWMKDALLSGRCPECLQDVSEGDLCGHGYGRPQVDGKGGIVVDPS